MFRSIEIGVVWAGCVSAGLLLVSFVATLLWLPGTALEVLCHDHTHHQYQIFLM